MKAKKIFGAVVAIVVNALMGAVMATTVGVSPAVGAVVMNVAAVTLMPAMKMEGCLGAGVLTEVWTGELVKSLRGKLEGTWLDGLPDSSSVVNNDVIHLVDVGVDPDVLINNSSYPIAHQKLDDGDIAIKLDKYQTKVTPITDDELYALSYDKMGRVKEAHANAISDAKFRKAAWNLCADKNTAKTPVLATTGAADGTRKRLTADDLVAMKKAMDKLGVPADMRRLVLCPDHVNDLLLLSQNFREQYNINRQEGTVGKLYGFEIYEFANTPIYSSTGAKKAIGASASDGDKQCSFAFYGPRVFKATGSTKMYYHTAEGDPENQQNTINFRHYFIAMPKKQDAGVVII